MLFPSLSGKTVWHTHNRVRNSFIYSFVGCKKGTQLMTLFQPAPSTQKSYIICIYTHTHTHQVRFRFRSIQSKALARNHTTRSECVCGVEAESGAEVGAGATTGNRKTLISRDLCSPWGRRWPQSRRKQEGGVIGKSGAYFREVVQSTPCKMLGWMKHKLESRVPGEISITDMQMTPPLWQKAEKN